MLKKLRLQKCNGQDQRMAIGYLLVRSLADGAYVGRYERDTVRFPGAELHDAELGIGLQRAGMEKYPNGLGVVDTAESNSSKSPS